MYIDIHTHVGGRVVIARGDRILYCEAVHPFEARGAEVISLSEGVVAVGETGLDYRKEYREFATEQRMLFARHIELANSANIPLIIHQVRALDDTLKLLSMADVPVIFHGFSGSVESARRVLGAGYYLSFGHLLLSNVKLAEVVKQIPLDRIFLESDESGVSIEQIYEKVTQLIDVSGVDLERQIEKNYEYVFMAREN